MRTSPKRSELSFLQVSNKVTLFFSKDSYKLSLKDQDLCFGARANVRPGAIRGGNILNLIQLDKRSVAKFLTSPSTMLSFPKWIKVKSLVITGKNGI